MSSHHCPHCGNDLYPSEHGWVGCVCHLFDETKDEEVTTAEAAVITGVIVGFVIILVMIGRAIFSA